MLIPLAYVLFTAIRTVLRSAINIMMYSYISSVFNKWIGLNSFLSFICSAYSISKITKFVNTQFLNARLRNKKPEEKIYLDKMTWNSPTSVK